MNVQPTSRLAKLVLEAGHYVYVMINIAAGYNAKTAGFRIFISGRTEDSICIDFYNKIGTQLDKSATYVKGII